MAKARKIDDKLARIKNLGRDPLTKEQLAELLAALEDKSNLVVAAAAEVIGERNLVAFAKELIAAYDRFLIEPAETDKLCRAKLAIIDALNKIGYDQPDIFLRAIRYMQIEPRWGGGEDTAAGLRSSAAFGLVRLGHADLLYLLADLLADPEKIARKAAAQALGAIGAQAATPLLRYKARIGDEEPDVIAECFAALLSASPKVSVSFIAEFLTDANEPVAEAAALALGESRRADAFECLQTQLRKTLGPSRETILLAISITRLPAAIDFLLEILAGDNQAAALAALNALAIHRHNETVNQRVAAIVTKKQVPSLLERFGKKFKTKE
ncbi:MAG TPA: HEAT repeat domain-containing protein [Gemmataceae bacterium]|nr:HEAT repeat domain-containing protein [Gemmataceae bacterium]